MRKPILALITLLLILAACGDDPPPTQIVMVVTATFGPGTGTPDTPLPATTGTPIVVTRPPATDAPPSTTPAPTGTTAPTGTPQPTATTLPALFPTNVTAPVQIAEEVFEHGRMFWLRHNLQVWVMINVPPDNANGGDWFCYNDTFVEGEPEIDETLVAPADMYQPRRGFGKLWREHPELKEGLGWATTPEFELTSGYTYIAGGYVENGQYFKGPGEHRLTTLYNESISFFESDMRGDCLGGTWRKSG